MPTLKGLTCSVDLTGRNQVLREFGTTWRDGFVETYVSVPKDPESFSIHLTCDDFDAEGIAVFVYINGAYQCNRNKPQLKKKASSSAKSVVDFRLRQEERTSKQKNGPSFAREFNFGDLYRVLKYTRDIEHPQEKNARKGTIEVIVLRCAKLPKKAHFRLPHEDRPQDRPDHRKTARHSLGRDSSGYYPPNFDGPSDSHYDGRRPSVNSFNSGYWAPPPPPSFHSHHSGGSHHHHYAAGPNPSPSMYPSPVIPSSAPPSYRPVNSPAPPAHDIPESAYEYGAGPIPTSRQSYGHRHSGSISEHNTQGIDPVMLDRLIAEAVQRGVEEARRNDYGSARENFGGNPARGWVQYQQSGVRWPAEAPNASRRSSSIRSSQAGPGEQPPAAWPSHFSIANGHVPSTWPIQNGSSIPSIPWQASATGINGQPPINWPSHRAGEAWGQQQRLLQGSAKDSIRGAGPVVDLTAWEFDPHARPLSEAQDDWSNSRSHCKRDRERSRAYRSRRSRSRAPSSRRSRQIPDSPTSSEEVFYSCSEEENSDRCESEDDSMATAEETVRPSRSSHRSHRDHSKSSRHSHRHRTDSRENREGSRKSSQRGCSTSPSRRSGRTHRSDSRPESRAPAEKRHFSKSSTRRSAASKLQREQPGLEAIQEQPGLETVPEFVRPVPEFVRPALEEVQTCARFESDDSDTETAIDDENWGPSWSHHFNKHRQPLFGESRRKWADVEDLPTENKPVPLSQENLGKMSMKEAHRRGAQDYSWSSQQAQTDSAMKGKVHGHVRGRPKYLDTFQKPYAHFRFNYRVPGQLEALFPGQVTRKSQFTEPSPDLKQGYQHDIHGSHDKYSGRQSARDEPRFGTRRPSNTTDERARRSTETWVQQQSAGSAAELRRMAKSSKAGSNKKSRTVAWDQTVDDARDWRGKVQW